MFDPRAKIRREAAVVVVFTIVGAILRFWNGGSLGLNQFDEGIYCFSGMSMLTPKGIAGINPSVIWFAPPLFPILVSFAYMVLGISDMSAILVSQVAGVLTIPAIGWVGRRTFGGGAGAMAAGLAALSGPDIVFSRMALTDSTFLLLWILAIGFGGLFLERPNILRAIAFGLAVGMAQNTKYNGYLAGTIVALTAILSCVFPSPAGRRPAFLALVFGSIAIVVAGTTYWPWYRFVAAQPGGYVALIYHQRSYLSGWTAWRPHWWLQMGQATALSGYVYGQTNWGLFAWPLSLLGGLFAAHGYRLSSSTSRWGSSRVRLGLLIGAVVLGSSPSVSWWLGLFALPWLLKDTKPAVRLLGVWCLVMSILTPFYHPYARLWLPLHAAGWLVLSWFVVNLGSDAKPALATKKSWYWRFVAVSLAVVISMVQDLAVEPRAHAMPGLLDPTDSLRIASEDLAKAIANASQSNAAPPFGRLRVVARPPLVFYLAMAMSSQPVGI